MKQTSACANNNRENLFALSTFLFALHFYVCLWDYFLNFLFLRSVPVFAWNFHEAIISFSHVQPLVMLVTEAESLCIENNKARICPGVDINFVDWMAWSFHNSPPFLRRTGKALFKAENGFPAATYPIGFFMEKTSLRRWQYRHFSSVHHAFRHPPLSKVPGTKAGQTGRWWKLDNLNCF